MNLHKRGLDTDRIKIACCMYRSPARPLQGCIILYVRLFFDKEFNLLLDYAFG